MRANLTTLFLLLLFSTSCRNSTTRQEDPANDQEAKQALFKLVGTEHHGITFRNDVVEDIGANYLVYDGMYQGGGVAVGDLNNDGLDDIFLCGNQVVDQLYLNKGNLQFENITTISNILQDNNWSMGATIADVDGNGYKDIYVCRFLWDQPDKRKNLLYLNQGDMTFTEAAETFGIADPGYSIQSTFLDYDKDGDLDLYVVNQPPNKKSFKKKLKGKIDHRFTDRFYRNDGSKFTDITEESGIKNYAYGLSATVADLNKDGWPDIYVANDYEEPDLVYMNNGNGTFSNKADESLRHMSNFSMGADIADINNDGWLDIYTADMVAEDNKRLKTNMSGMNPTKFWLLANAGYHFQYMFNSLQINNGNGLFSEIAQLGQVHATDWSWSPIIADLDNDGHKDITLTNGQKRDVRNNDYNINRSKKVEQTLAEVKKQGKGNHAFNPLELLDLAPSVKLKNYAFRNNGDLTFTKVMDEWGLDELSWSQGSAVSDLDNDGDLDLIINNYDDPLFLYQNTAADNGTGNYLRFRFEDSEAESFGAEVTDSNLDGSIQMGHLHPIRGYLSQSEQAVHLGLGNATSVKSVTVKWPNGKVLYLTDVKSNQEFKLSLKDASAPHKVIRTEPLFSEVKTDLPSHIENAFNDYEKEILLPHKMSTLGPYMAVADVNNDGTDDAFVGGAAGQSGTLLLSNSGKYSMKELTGKPEEMYAEDMGSSFFDADGDGDLDLYVSSGGNEFKTGAMNYQDRLYLNDGKGNFSGSSSIPMDRTSDACVLPIDIDADGSMELFVGGRQMPGKWPFPASSRILKFSAGSYIDVTAEVAPDLVDIGMVTDANKADVNNDGNEDLILCGEWMAPTVFINISGKLSIANSGMQKAVGWWNTVEPVDVDNDGDLDIVAGNLGMNIKYKATEASPFSVYCHDFDTSGSLDIVLSYYEKGSCFPVRGRECSSQQMPFIKKKFPTYDQFGEATVTDIHGEHLEKSLQYHATEFRSGIWINNGSGSFTFKAFANEAQIAPIQAVVAHDVNADGNTDLIMAGNYYNREVETTRSDAGIGCVLIGDGAGQFKPMHPTEHGLQLYKDVRDIKLMDSPEGDKMLLVANNNATVQMYRFNSRLP